MLEKVFKRLIRSKSRQRNGPMPLVEKRGQSPHEAFYFRYRGYAALRKGDWKIVREKPNRPWQLFNLAEDRVEASDRAKDFPMRVKELNDVFAGWEWTF